MSDGLQPPASAAGDDLARTVDPLIAGFDQVVALAGYALLFLSVFMAGVPALASYALALAHQRDSHPIARSHFGFQRRIFYTALVFFALALGSFLFAGGLAASKLVQFARDHLPGMAGAGNDAGVHAWSGAIAAGFVGAAILFAIIAVVWLWVASAFGFFRLLAGKPIGYRPAALHHGRL